MLDEEAWFAIFSWVDVRALSISFTLNSLNHVFMDFALCTGAQ